MEIKDKEKLFKALKEYEVSALRAESANKDKAEKLDKLATMIGASEKSNGPKTITEAYAKIGEIYLKERDDL